MKLKIIVIIATIMLFSCANTSGKKGFFWKAEKGNKKFYILGSIHLAKKSFYPLSPKILNAFNESKELYQEIGDISQEKISALVLQKGLLPSGKTLKSALSANIYQKLKNRFKKNGIANMSGFQQMKPWLAMITLTAIELQKAGFQQNRGIDLYFKKLAKKKSIPLNGLETAEFQLSLFDNMTSDDLEDFLTESLNELDSQIKLIKDFEKNWATGDLSTLNKLLEMTQKSKSSGFYKKLIEKRNQSMSQKLEKKLKSNHTVFVVVGALHLIGENGMVEYFKGKGFKLSQIK